MESHHQLLYTEAWQFQDPKMLHRLNHHVEIPNRPIVRIVRYKYYSQLLRYRRLLLLRLDYDEQPGKQYDNQNITTQIHNVPEALTVRYYAYQQLSNQQHLSDCGAYIYFNNQRALWNW